MVRKQLYLDEKSEEGLRDLALMRGVSEAFLVREAVKQYLASASKPVRRDDNPLWKLLDLSFEGGPPDGSVNHDHYLYDDLMERKTRKKPRKK